MAVAVVGPSGGCFVPQAGPNPEKRGFEPVVKAFVLLNQNAGGNSEPGHDAIQAALEVAGIETTFSASAGGSFEEEARAAVGRFDAIIAAGGDGTVSAAAAAMAGSDTPLGILPVGTLNHFAKDAGIPIDLNQAASVIAASHTLRVDLGKVNDRVFANNCSVGVYARALVRRDATRKRLGLGKWPAMALAVLKVFRRSPLLEVSLSTPEGLVTRRTPLVFVGNNCYSLELLNVGARQRLDGGELSLYVANTTTRWGMVKLAVRAAVGRLEQSRDFESLCLPEVRVHKHQRRRRSILVAIDGELVRLAPPLQYRIWPGALRVIVPSPADNAEATR